MRVQQNVLYTFWFLLIKMLVMDKKLRRLLSACPKCTSTHGIVYAIQMRHTEMPPRCCCAEVDSKACALEFFSFQRRSYDSLRTYLWGFFNKRSLDIEIGGIGKFCFERPFWWPDPQCNKSLLDLSFHREIMSPTAFTHISAHTPINIIVIHLRGQCDNEAWHVSTWLNLPTQ